MYRMKVSYWTWSQLVFNNNDMAWLTRVLYLSETISGIAISSTRMHFTKRRALWKLLNNYERWIYNIQIRIINYPCNVMIRCMSCLVIWEAWKKLSPLDAGMDDQKVWCQQQPLTTAHNQGKKLVDVTCLSFCYWCDIYIGISSYNNVLVPKFVGKTQNPRITRRWLELWSCTLKP